MLAEIRQQLHKLPRGLHTRFAPSPTGFLHLGHAASALFVWGIADAVGADVLLRIEDHDRGRVRRDYEKALIEDLLWLGFIQKPEFVRQSDHGSRYHTMLDRLRHQGRIYACSCSRKEIQERTGEQSADELRYDGYCRDRSVPEKGAGLRVRFDERSFSFVDLCTGAQMQKPAEQCGDLLLQDRDGNWTYNFAVTVDDLTEEIDLIIRGQDILSASGRQLQLRAMLDAGKPPRFLHHPLIMENPGQKLSKRDGSTSLRHLRSQGLTAAQILGQAAHAVGLLDKPEDLAAHELKGLFQ